MISAILKLLQRWSDWSGDLSLDRAIKEELRRQGYAVHAARTRQVRLVAVQRPGWVQVQRFQVETLDQDRQAVTLLGLVRDDGRKQRMEVLLTTDAALFRRQLAEWSEGLIFRNY
jgi:hypothetical protein